MLAVRKYAFDPAVNACRSSPKRWTLIYPVNVILALHEIRTHNLRKHYNRASLAVVDYSAGQFHGSGAEHMVVLRAFRY